MDALCEKVDSRDVRLLWVAQKVNRCTIMTGNLSGCKIRNLVDVQLRQCIRNRKRKYNISIYILKYKKHNDINVWIQNSNGDHSNKILNVSRRCLLTEHYDCTY